MKKTIFVVLSDITPNRGTIVRIATSEDCAGGRVYEWRGEKEPIIGDRAWVSGPSARGSTE